MDMKKRIAVIMMAMMLALTTLSLIPAEQVFAEETDNQSEAEQEKGYEFGVKDLVNADNYLELSVGEKVYCSATMVDAEGNTLEYGTDWVFATEDEIRDYDIGVGLNAFYSVYDDANEAFSEENCTSFEGEIPEEAFGNYIYKYAVAFTNENDSLHLVFSVFRSKYKVTYYDDNLKLSYSMSDDGKSAIARSLWGLEGSKLTFGKSITCAGKKYKVTEIGESIIEGVEGIKNVSIHSGIKKIGAKAFKDAKNLKTISIDGKKTIGKDSFSGINKNAVIKIKAKNADYKKMVKEIKKTGGAPKTVKFKQVK